MVKFAWTLLLDDRETIDGVLDREIVLPPGEPQVVPLAMRLDLVEFFDGNASEMLNLALRFAGVDAEAASVKLRAEPTIETPLGPILRRKDRQPPSGDRRTSRISERCRKLSRPIKGARGCCAASALAACRAIRVASTGSEPGSAAPSRLSSARTSAAPDKPAARPRRPLTGTGPSAVPGK
jgi:hypothetical protein